MDLDHLNNELHCFWDQHITPTLVDYIKIPNKSPVFDPGWETAGHMQNALDLAVNWIKKHQPDGTKLLVKKEPGRTPLIILDILGQRAGNVLMYGHMDKQPEMEGWHDGLGPWTPVLEDGKLYGRGCADDGYALFAAVGIVRALQNQGLPLPRIVILIEFSEESGSLDLPFYLEQNELVIGKPDLVVCLDSGAENFEQFWTTVSLRGLVSCTLRVDVLKEGIHSGAASGVVPSSFRIVRQLISRLEDENTGEIKLEGLRVEVPPNRLSEVNALAAELGSLAEHFPWYEKLTPTTSDPVEGVLRRTWYPALSIVGMDGVPAVKDGGNVLRPYTTLKLSMRIPPTLDAEKAKTVIEKALLSKPPYQATVSVDFDALANGWNAPELDSVLLAAIEDASQAVFNKSALAMGEGGTIPFMAMLEEKFPSAQFLITGVLGPKSNAHGPNEFLHLEYAKKLSSCIGLILNHFQK
ncbi:MAG: M20/M25/M40 family metallo-hydrolase [Fidelibacterota bacterium]